MSPIDNIHRNKDNLKVFTVISFTMTEITMGPEANEVTELCVTGFRIKFALFC